jgi:outer membrane lipoprotein-sorting protein
MRKKSGSVIIALLVAGVLAAPAAGQTAKDVLAKMIEAMGGRQALEAVKDTTLSGTFEFVSMGMSGGMTVYAKEPNKARIDIELMGMVITQAFDGQVAWFVNPQTGATEEMPAAQAAEMQRRAMGNDMLLNPEKVGVTYTLKDREKVEDKDYIVLEQKLADGFTTKLYLDPATYLVVRQRAKGLNPMTSAEADTDTVISDYRSVNGIKMPFSSVAFQEGAELMRITFAKAVCNTGLEDTFFAMSK